MAMRDKAVAGTGEAFRDAQTKALWSRACELGEPAACVVADVGKACMLGMDAACPAHMDREAFAEGYIEGFPRACERLQLQGVPGVPRRLSNDAIGHALGEGQRLGAGLLASHKPLRGSG